MQNTSERGIGSALSGAAASLDERGRRAWNGREARDARRRSGYVAEAVVDGVLLWFISSSLVWSLPFLTSAFVAPRAVMELSLVASLVANLAFVVYDEGWFRHSLKAGLAVLAFVATYSLLTVFPFAFETAGVAEMVRIGLVVGLIGIAIGAVVEFLQFAFGWIRSDGA